MKKKFCLIYYIKIMEAYCVSCKRNTVNENSNVRKTKQNILTLLSNCAICGKNNRLFSIDSFKKHRLFQIISLK